MILVDHIRGMMDLGCTGQDPDKQRGRAGADTSRPVQQPPPPGPTLRIYGMCLSICPRVCLCAPRLQGRVSSNRTLAGIFQTGGECLRNAQEP